MRFAPRPAALVTLLACALALAACGKRPTPGIGNPVQLNPADYRAPGIPARYGDVDPHDWEGRAPNTYSIHGIDAARYQGEITWSKAAAAGIRFGWLKATEGGDLADPAYGMNSAGARAAGVPVGAYHFYFFCRTPEEQARWFIQNVPRVPGDLPPVLDMEWNHQSSCKKRPDGAAVRDIITRYSQVITAHYGTRPVVYVTPDFYEHNDLGQMAGVEFWLRSVADHPSVRYPGERWTFWQYTGTGVVPGVKGQSDINAFAGDEAAWAGWLAARVQR